MPDNEAPPPERLLTPGTLVFAARGKLVPEAKNVVDVVMMLASRADAAEARADRLAEALRKVTYVGQEDASAIDGFREGIAIAAAALEGEK